MGVQKMPAISVVIPIYNVEKYLCRCLNSVLNQTFTDWEAVCVNDGSPDKSDEILAKYAARDNRFKIVNKKNGGLSDARNVGVTKASGDYVLFLDSDDFIHPQTLEYLHGVATQNNADMVVFQLNKSARKQMTRVLESGEDVSRFIPNEYNKHYNLSKIDYLVTDNVLSKSTERHTLFDGFKVKKCYPVLKMLRREIAKKHKFIRGIIIEDFPWWTEVMFSYPHTVITKAPFYFYTPNSTSILGNSKLMFMINSICKGLKYAYEVCENTNSVRDKKIYNREFLWPFTITTMRLVRQLSDKKDINSVKKEMKSLYNIGVFDKPQTHRARKYKRRIEDFISQIF